MKNIVIIGGGFAGTHCAKKLEKKHKVTLIDKKDYFEYTPAILRCIVNPKHIKDIQVKHKDYLKKTKIIIGSAKNITKTTIEVNKKKIEYDYLIIATGVKYEGIFKAHNLIQTNRAKTLEQNHTKFHQAKRVLIIGGGVVGVELAAELSTHEKEKTIQLIQSSDKLIPRNNTKSQKYAENFLKKQNINIQYNTRITNIQTTSKEQDIIFLSIGTKARQELTNENILKNKLTTDFHIITTPTLQLPNHKNIFIAGDITDIKEEKSAQNAIEHAKIIVKNIYKLETNKPLKTYKPKPRIMVISLGKYNGILEYKNIAITGKIPALLKWIIEKIVMHKYR